DAADPGLGVGSTLEVRVRARVAAQAGRIHLLLGQLGQHLDLGYVAAAFYVGLARPVAALAGHAVAAMLQRELGMRVVLKLLDYIGVAGRADLRAKEIGGFRRGGL